MGRGGDPTPGQGCWDIPCNVILREHSSPWLLPGTGGALPWCSGVPSAGVEGLQGTGNRDLSARKGIYTGIEGRKGIHTGTEGKERYLYWNRGEGKVFIVV